MPFTIYWSSFESSANQNDRFKLLVVYKKKKKKTPHEIHDQYNYILIINKFLHILWQGRTIMYLQVNIIDRWLWSLIQLCSRMILVSILLFIWSYSRISVTCLYTSNIRLNCASCVLIRLGRKWDEIYNKEDSNLIHNIRGENKHNIMLVLEKKAL